jgi:octopine/nopaline transport system substrate-binding protein
MKKCSKLFLVVFMMFAFVWAGSVAAKDYNSIKISTEGAYAPYNFKDAGGNLVGFDVDLAAELCKRMGSKCTIVEQAWDGIIPSLLAGKYDAIMAAMSITEKRQEVISFSKPYIYEPIIFATTKDNVLSNFKTDLTNITLADLNAEEKAVFEKLEEALKDKKVGVQVSTTHENVMNKLLPKVKLAVYDKIDNMVLDLTAGRIDAGLSSLSYFKPLLDKPESKNLKLVGPQMTGGMLGPGVGIGIRKEDAKLVDMFNKAIDEMIADGSLGKLAVKWFGFDGSPKE